jgi:hypothetical protein
MKRQHARNIDKKPNKKVSQYSADDHSRAILEYCLKNFNKIGWLQI